MVVKKACARNFLHGTVKNIRKKNGTIFPLWDEKNSTDRENKQIISFMKRYKFYGKEKQTPIFIHETV